MKILAQKLYKFEYQRTRNKNFVIPHACVFACIFMSNYNIWIPKAVKPSSRMGYISGASLT